MAVCAFLFNWLVLPRVGGKAMWREAEHGRGYPLGILLYPLSVLALVLVFRDRLEMAAAIWGILAFGDGMASLVGQAPAGRACPGTTARAGAGSSRSSCSGPGRRAADGVDAAPAARCVGLGLDPGPAGAGRARSARWWSRCRRRSTTTSPSRSPAPCCCRCCRTRLRPRSTRSPTSGQRALAVGLASQRRSSRCSRTGSARSTCRERSPPSSSAPRSRWGSAWPGLVVMIAFFVLGSAATRLGYRVKAARGIAQEKGGARGWRNAWANGGVAAFLALMAALDPAHASVYAVAYAAAVATAAADTCSSEVGKAYGRRTFLITTFRPVPPGHGGRRQPGGDARRAWRAARSWPRWAPRAGSTAGGTRRAWSRWRGCSAAWRRASSAPSPSGGAGWTTTC